MIVCYQVMTYPRRRWENIPILEIEVFDMDDETAEKAAEETALKISEACFGHEVRWCISDGKTNPLPEAAQGHYVRFEEKK